MLLGRNGGYVNVVLPWIQGATRCTEPEDSDLCNLHRTFNGGDLNLGEPSRVTQDDGTVTLCTLRAATILSCNCCAALKSPIPAQAPLQPTWLRNSTDWLNMLEGREVQNCELKKFSVFRDNFCFSKGHVERLPPLPHRHPGFCSVPR